MTDTPTAPMWKRPTGSVALDTVLEQHMSVWQKRREYIERYVRRRKGEVPLLFDEWKERKRAAEWWEKDYAAK